MRDVGSPCSRHAGSGMETRTSETQDKAAWTVAESVREADIDHGAWSSRRGNPRAYPPARRSERDGIPRAPHRPARFGRSAPGPVHAACQRRQPAPSCGSPVCRMRGDHTGPRPEQYHRQPERAGRPGAPGREGVIRPLPCTCPGGEAFHEGQNPSREGGLISEHLKRSDVVSNQYGAAGQAPPGPAADRQVAGR
jgi:hypothetical protein